MIDILLVASLAIFACAFTNRISDKVGLPALLVFILLGMLFGEDGALQIPFEDYGFAESACSIGLIFIMFFGGFGTKWPQARSVAVKAISLSTLGVLLTTLFTAFFCRILLHFSVLESLLMGAVLSSTDAASVFSVLRSKQLNLKDNTASLLEVESGSNDPFAYMLTVLILTMMAGSVTVGEMGILFFQQMVFGLGVGALVGFLALGALKHYEFSNSGLQMAFVIGVAVFSYAFSSFLGGNGYLSTYLCGILLGNNDFKDRIPLIHFFNGITGLMQMMIFFLLGLLASPSAFGAVLLPALVIFLILTFLARPLAVWLLLTPQHASLPQQGVINWCGLRGAASIVFAIMATLGEIRPQSDVFHITFLVVLFSISLQGSLLPLISKKLHMIDNSQNVLTTFTDYVDEEDVQFMKFAITKGHPWLGQSISVLPLPPRTLAAVIIRDGQNIPPDGNTVLQEGDTLVLTAPNVEDNTFLTLRELPILPGNRWIGKTLQQYGKKHASLVIIIRRNGENIIPNGQTVIEENDVLVMNTGRKVKKETMS